MKRFEIMTSDHCPTSLGDSVMFQWQMLQRSLREAITSHFEQGHDVEGFEQRPENCGDSLDALNELAAVWSPRNEYCGAQIRADALGIVSKSQNWLEAYRTIHERYGEYGNGR